MNEAGEQIEGAWFPFKYARTRIAIAILVVLLIGWPWFIFHTGSFDKQNYHGRGVWLEAIIKASPAWMRVCECVAMEVYFCYVLMAIYLPCTREMSLIVLKEDKWRGFGFWGQDEEMATHAVLSLRFRNGAAILRGADKTIRIPLSLLELNEDQQKAIRSALERKT